MRKPRTQLREPSPYSEDESIDWMNGPMPGRSQHKENSPPDELPGNGMPQKRQMDEIAPQKLAPWMPLDAASGMTPRTTAPPSESKGPTLSMTPRSVSNRSATPRSMTPRSSIGGARDATPRSMTPRGFIAQDSRSKAVPSAPPRRDAACQVTPVSAPEAWQPRGDLTPRSMTPRGTTPQGRGAAPGGDVTPRGMTPRNSNTASAAVLSMTPQLISRRELMPRNGTPRGSTPGGSVRGMRKSASEVVLPRNS